jgi:hypothetical protein
MIMIASIMTNIIKGQHGSQEVHGLVGGVGAEAVEGVDGGRLTRAAQHVATGALCTVPGLVRLRRAQQLRDPVQL